MLVFLRSCRVLANLQRCNQLNRTKPYSVAEHSYFCAILALVLCDYENHINQEKKLDTVKVIIRSLLHDAPEILTGDILYPVKYFNERVRANLEKMELDLVDNSLFKGLNEAVTENYKEHVICAKDRTPEGRMMTAIDKIEIMLFALEEFEMGNRAFTHIMDTAMEILENNDCFGFQSVRELLDEVKAALRTVTSMEPRSSNNNTNRIGGL